MNTYGVTQESQTDHIIYYRPFGHLPLHKMKE